MYTRKLCLFIYLSILLGQTCDKKSVIQSVEKLESQFRQLQTQILTELKEKKVTVSTILNTLTLLPIALIKEYKESITDVKPDLRRETTIDDMFQHLNPLLNFLGYGLLKHIIDMHGSNTLKIRMNEYKIMVDQFMKETTIKEMIDAKYWPAEHDDIPPHFSRFKAKIGKDYENFTLYDLEELRRKYLGEVKLCHIVVILIGLQVANSFIVQWIVPSAVVQQLIECGRDLDYGFYIRNRILDMVVDEKQIFSLLPDSKPSVTEVQTKAVAVTVNYVYMYFNQISGLSRPKRDGWQLCR